jgi:osmotically-inducible protein OsmY
MRQDHDLQRLVLEHLDFDPSLNASHIGVAVRDGIVTLSGHVPSFSEKVRAEVAAGNVRGVRAVVDEIKVELPGHCDSPDELVGQRAFARLASNTTVPLDRLQLSVKDGVVTVRGEVDWQYQRAAAINDLREISCIRDIRNEILIKPPVQAYAVSDRIRGGFERLGLSRTDTIGVVTRGSEVQLSGTVGSWHERGMAESIAWSVPGVSHVDNQLTVT